MTSGRSVSAYILMILSGHLAASEEHALTIAWLASAEAAHISGQD